MQHSELISVAMGVRYRRRELTPLRRSIESILRQSYSDLEFLICENESTDAAKALLQEYVQQDNRIRIIDGSGTTLLGEKLNRCLSVARGNWIARQDDDDYSLPDRLSLQMEFLKARRQYAFVGCSVKIEQEDAIVGVREFPTAPELKDFLFVQPFIHPTLLFRKDCLDAVKGYSQSQLCSGCEDYDLLLRLYQAGYKGANLPDCHFVYHIPSPSTCTRSYSMRINEMVTRWNRFHELGLLPGALPYVLKPVVVGLIPHRLLSKLKDLHRTTTIQKRSSDE